MSTSTELELDVEPFVEPFVEPVVELDVGELPGVVAVCGLLASEIARATSVWIRSKSGLEVFTTEEVNGRLVIVPSFIFSIRVTQAGRS